MTKSLQYVKDLVKDFSPNDMTEVLRYWLKYKDARLCLSLEWKPQDKIDLGDKAESIFLQSTKDNEVKSN